ncbi:MAG: hypothetical protein C0595_04490 [Marinilabiliales bacterium]|nr:MAG: hypothetical protein C0595_04490 [Marinilabiliales bacterium]
MEANYFFCHALFEFAKQKKISKQLQKLILCRFWVFRILKRELLNRSKKTGKGSLSHPPVLIITKNFW